tara:strand:- start:646 stop:1791 length:1146 start_codon:yes stop_codon:yes gene_type:complete
MFGYRQNIDRKDVEVSSVVRKFTEGDYVIDSIYQRGSRWTLSMKRDFIYDTLIYPITVPVYIDARPSRKDGNMAILDGQQRTITFGEFTNNEFRLGAFVEDIDGYSLANCYFDDLDEEVKKHLLSAQIPQFIYKDDTMTDKDMAELYLKINSGMPLNNAEKRKAMNSHLTKVFKEIQETYSLFSKTEEPKFISKTAQAEGHRSILDFILQNFLQNSAKVTRNKENLEKQTLSEEALSISINDEVIQNMIESIKYLEKSLKPYTDHGDDTVRNFLTTTKMTKGLLGKNHVRMSVFLHHDLVRNRGYNLDGKEKEFGEFLMNTIGFGGKEFSDFHRNDHADSQEALHKFLLKGITKILKETNDLEEKVGTVVDKKLGDRITTN